MSRYKGQLRAKRTELDFPHHVDIVIPPGGLGTRLDAMYEFHAQHGSKPQRGHGQHSADGAVIRWCFADASLAAASASDPARCFRDGALAGHWVDQRSAYRAA
jgi:hypothetical protein